MPSPSVHIACEGEVDLAVARRLLRHFGAEPGFMRPAGGKARLDALLPKYIEAARRGPWLLLRDLDGDAACAPLLAAHFAPRPATGVFRIAVRAVESWFLADRAGIADLIRCTLAQVPGRPDELVDPKRALVDLAHRSRSPIVRRALLPRPGAGVAAGAEYAGWMIDFAENGWNLEQALREARSPSLSSAARRISELVASL